MSSKAANPYAGLIAAIAYSVVSITITLSNKFVLSTYDGAKFDSAQTLTVLQGLVTVVCLHFMKMFKYIDYPSFDWSMARRVAPLSFVSHSYEKFHLLMPLYVCRTWKGKVTSVEHQRLAWVEAGKLRDYPVPPADEPLISVLQDWL